MSISVSAGNPRSLSALTPWRDSTSGPASISGGRSTYPPSDDPTIISAKTVRSTSCKSSTVATVLPWRSTVASSQKATTWSSLWLM